MNEEEQLRAYQGRPKAESQRLIDLERTEILRLRTFPPRFVLRVTGTKPFSNMEVGLVSESPRRREADGPCGSQTRRSKCPQSEDTWSARWKR